MLSNVWGYDFLFVHARRGGITRRKPQRAETDTKATQLGGIAKVKSSRAGTKLVPARLDSWIPGFLDPDPLKKGRPAASLRRCDCQGITDAFSASFIVRVCYENRASSFATKTSDDTWHYVSHSLRRFRSKVLYVLDGYLI